jgi:hypothetical protein
MALMPSDSSSTIPLSRSLPLELERDIFEMTAKAHRGSAVRLILVAHRVYAWYVFCRITAPPLLILFSPSWTRIVPILYDMLTIRFRRELPLLEGNVGDCFAKHAKTLCLSTLSYSAALLQVPRFRAVVNLAFWPNGDPFRPGTTTFLAALENHRLKRLSTDVVYLRHGDSVRSSGMLFGHPALSQLTHLEITIEDDEEDWSVTVGLTALNHLTHFGYRLDANDIVTMEEPSPMIQALRTILSTTVSLKVLALIVDLHPLGDTQALDVVHDWLKTAQLDDPRLIVLRSGRDDIYSAIYNDWEAFMNGRPDMWTRAEDMIQKRWNRTSHLV